jgi:hypothetical protein
MSDRGPPRPNGDTELRKLQRRLDKLEYDLADFKQQHRADMDSVRQAVESKERVVVELSKLIDELKRGDK